jgi:hypothetical protein
MVRTRTSVGNARVAMGLVAAALVSPVSPRVDHVMDRHAGTALSAGRIATLNGRILNLQAVDATRPPYETP